MPRKAAPQKIRGTTPLSVLEQAAQLVHDGVLSTRDAAARFNIKSHITVYRAAKKLEEGQKVTVGFNPKLRVFTPDQEKEIEKYLMTAADHYFGISPIEVRKLVYQLAMKYDINVPHQWKQGILILHLLAYWPYNLLYNNNFYH